MFNKVQKDELAGIDCMLKCTVIQYVDDIILCSSETSNKDSIKFLQMLAEKGHKVFQKKNPAVLPRENGFSGIGNNARTQKHLWQSARGNPQGSKAQNH